MQLYAITRRAGFESLEDLERAGARSAAVAAQPGSGVRWIRSYALSEPDGRIGTVCIYEAEGEEAIRAHAAAAGLPCDECVPIAATVVVNPDPEPVPAGA